MAGLNVLVYCQFSLSGGGVAYLRNIVPRLTERFAREGAEHRLVFLAHEEQASLFQGIDDSMMCWVHGPRPTGYRRIWWERRNLPRTLAENNIHVLYNPSQVWIPACGVRQVMMLQNMEPFFFRKYRYSLRAWLRNYLLHWASLRSLPRADRWIAISSFVREHLKQQAGIAEERIRTIYHGRPVFDRDGTKGKHQRVLRRIGVGKNYVLTCGSLLPYRRSEDVIVAFDRCADRLPAGTQLVIAGDGTDRRYAALLRKAVADSPHRERIVVLGHVPWETMCRLYRNCLACVLATEIEACPNIAIEAMAAGCVIVSCNRPPLPEIFQGCSLEYQARDVDQLAQQMRMAVEDGAMREQMKAQALQRAVAFSWDSCAAETFAALTEW